LRLRGIVPDVSEDDRQRRRLGDATRDRIADLADGWSVPAQAIETERQTALPPVEPEPAPDDEDGADPGLDTVRQAAAPEAPAVARTLTDPAEALSTAPYERTDGFEQARPTVVAPPPEGLQAAHPAEPGRPRQAPPPPPGSKRPTSPPPPPGSKRPTSPPPPPSGARATGPVAVAARPGRDDDATTVDPGAARAAAAGTPAPPSAPRVGASTAPAHVVAGLRDAPTLPRRPGVAGLLAYVLTAWRGVRRARKELAAVDAELASLKAARAERLAELGRAAVADDRFDQTAVRTSRDELADIEERRSRHAGAAAASDAELEAIEREREREHHRLAREIEADEAEAARLDAELAPLERDAAATRKRAAELKDTLASIDRKMSAAQASLVSVKGQAADRAAVEAELASLRADRQAVARDEPTIAAALDALLPRIAALTAERAAATERVTAARRGQEQARARAADRVAAVEARRKVEARAVAEAQGDRDRALVELGERLYVDRPRDLTRRLDAVEQRDVAIATAERRAIELRELIASVDRGAVWRGAALWLLLLGAAAAAAILIATA
jgi:hypothetical protein